MHEVKFRLVNPGLQPGRTKLELPGWASAPEPRNDGSQEAGICLAALLSMFDGRSVLADGLPLAQILYTVRKKANIRTVIRAERLNNMAKSRLKLVTPTIKKRTVTPTRRRNGAIGGVTGTLR
jgi:hypothetical protein